MYCEVKYRGKSVERVGLAGFHEGTEVLGAIHDLHLVRPLALAHRPLHLHETRLRDSTWGKKHMEKSTEERIYSVESEYSEERISEYSVERISECSVESSSEDVEKMTRHRQLEISSWFFGAPLKDIFEENLHSWLSWAFWYREVKDLSEKDTLVMAGE